MIIPLAHERFVEVVTVLDHPASDKAPFGQAVRARSEAEQRLGREAVAGCRRRPDGVEIKWRQLGVKGLMADPQLPFYIHWEDKSVHPSVGATADVTISGLQIAGDPDRVCEWLGLPADQTSTVIDFTFVAPHGTPGLLTVTFDTPKGPVTI